jgi:hypothetical protein
MKIDYRVSLAGRRWSPDFVPPASPALLSSHQQGVGSQEGAESTGAAGGVVPVDPLDPVELAAVSGVLGAVVVVVGTVNVSGFPYASIGGVTMGPNGPPRNWAMVAAASSGCTTSTSPA